VRIGEGESERDVEGGLSTGIGGVAMLVESSDATGGVRGCGKVGVGGVSFSNGVGLRGMGGTGIGDDCGREQGYWLRPWRASIALRRRSSDACLAMAAGDMCRERPRRCIAWV
jgi:hypothetical protein